MRNIFSILFILASLVGFSQKINREMAMGVANEFIQQNFMNCLVASVEPYTSSTGDTMYFVVQAEPHQYIIVAADQRVQPVLAWSNTSQFDSQQPFAEILEADINNRLTAFEHYNTEQKTNIKFQWIRFTDGLTPIAKYQVWPPAGSTSTGGWIETHWTQSAPYNQFCPMDPVTSTRSYTGCPATAMAQIINYLKTTQNTRFDDADDYHHNYAGRNYYIDDDWNSLSFLSFPDLNVWLDSIDILYQSGTDASGASAAALTFACGTACVQVYTSAGSGTFSVNQAYTAYQRFGFANSQLLTTTDSIMYNMLIDNMKLGYPAHLAVVDSAWNVGHNVVVDGYNTDGYFHINFGWGGSNDGWWLVPDPSFPYSMGVLEGIVLNIIPVSASIEENEKDVASLFFPNPAKNEIFFENTANETVQYQIFNISGQLVKTGFSNGSIEISELPAGVFEIKLSSNSIQCSEKIVIVK